MTFLTPLAAIIAAAIAIPALVLLYFLKLRRRLMVVSSTLLWRKSIQDLQVNSPFEKLKKNLLLLLQLLILIALLLALARPAFRMMATRGEQIIIVVDHSASMNAVDQPPSRLDKARSRAIELIDSFQGQGGIMVVSFAQDARVMQPFTTDKSLLRAAVNRIEPTDYSSRLAPAFRLIEPYAIKDSADGNQVTIYVLSDGRVEDAQDLSLPGGQLIFDPIRPDPANKTADNLAIVALSARRDYEKPQRVEVFARLANYGSSAAKASLSIAIDGKIQRVLAVEVPGTLPSVQDDSGSLVFPEPATLSIPFEITAPGQAVITVSHDLSDTLLADNSASLVLGQPQPLQVLLVSEGNVFLSKVLESVGVRKLEIISPKRYEDLDPANLRRGVKGPDEGFDIIIFDNISPTTLPQVNSLYLGGVPRVENLLLVPTAPSDPQNQVVLNWDRDNPILRYVSLDDLAMLRPGRLALPTTASILATGPVGPVMAEWQNQGVRHLMVSFNVVQTNWPMQVSFTVFVTNIMNNLSLAGESGSAIAFHPGDMVAVPVEGDPKSLTYTGPAELQAPVEQGKAMLPMIPRAGLYHTDPALAHAPFADLAVNLTDPQESDTRVQLLKLPVRAASQVTMSKDAAVSQDIWPWFVMAALAILMVEWLVYTRKMHW